MTTSTSTSTSVAAATAATGSGTGSGSGSGSGTRTGSTVDARRTGDPGVGPTDLDPAVAALIAEASFADERQRRVPDAPWARLLSVHLGEATDYGDAPPVRPSSAGWSAPYGWLLGPLAARAWSGLAGRLDAGICAATLTAHVERAAFWLAPALHADFAAYRRRHAHRLETALAARAAAPPTRLYDSYVARAGRAGVAVWRRRPVLARLAAQLAVDEVALLGHLLDHLRDDGAALADLLGVAALAPLDAVVTGLGDRHDGGRSVCRVRFADGREAIYRPRRHDGLALLHAARDTRNAPRPPLPRQLARHDHTWVCHVAPGTPTDPDAYHAAAGSLLGLLHAAGATDIHRDNLVRTATGPSVVDAETVVHPAMAFETAPVSALVDRPLPPTELVDSALRVGLLPCWDHTGDGEPLDAGHLVPDAGAVTWIDVPGLEHPGTDGETLVRVPVPLSPRHELPEPGYDPARHADTVARAYAASAAGTPPMPARGHRLRLLPRYTRRYVDLLLATLSRADVRDAASWERALSALLDGCADVGPEIRAAELSDLRRLDVPYLEWEPASGAVLHRGRRIATVDAHRARRPDLGRNVALIRTTLRAGDGRPGLVSDRSRPPAERAAALAGALGRDLAERAVPVPGGLSWLGSEYRHGRFPRLPVNWSLYDGQAGIALGLASAARAEPDLREVTRRATVPMLRRVLADPDGLCRRTGSGYLHGVAGVLWTLRRLPALVGGWSVDLAADCRHAADALTRYLATALLDQPDLRYGDLAGGGAGALLVLTEPATRPTPPWVRAAIEDTAAAQLTGAVPGAGYGQPAGSGVAHGPAGVAWALARAAGLLGGTVGDALTGAAHRLFARDRPAGWSWCAGAAGVRLAMSDTGTIRSTTPVSPASGPTPETPATPTATPATASAVDGPADTAPHHLCCGLLGYALAGAADDAGRTGPVAVLDRLATDGVPRYLRPLPAGLHQPGLFQGAAGLALGVLLLTHGGLPDPLRIGGEVPCPA